MPLKKKKGATGSGTGKGKEKNKVRQKVEPPISEGGGWQMLGGVERALSTKERRRDEMESDIVLLRSGCDCDGQPITGGGAAREAQMAQLRAHNRWCVPYTTGARTYSTV